MTNVKLKQIIIDQDGYLTGVDEGGRVWWFRGQELRKGKNDNLDGKEGDLVEPIGWRPLCMRKIESVGDYREAREKDNRDN